MLDDLTDILAQWQIPGMGLSIVEGSDATAIGLGVKAATASDPVTPDTLFGIASTTKAITTTVMAMLVDEGRLNWDDPVRQHLDWFRLADPIADSAVTVRDLVSHRTGLPRHDMLWYRSAWTREEIVRRAGRAPLTASIRAKYQYNNIMFMAAGLVIQAVTGETWESFTRRRLFGPLGMSANFSVTEVESAPDKATPHRLKEGDVVSIPWLELDAEGPGGSVNASASAMARWLKFLLAKGEWSAQRLVSWKNLRETWTPQMVVPMEEAELPVHEAMGSTQNSYGMGWSVTDYRGHKLLSHGGAINGFRSNVCIVPEQGIGISLLVNLGPTSGHMAIRNMLLDRFLGLPEKEWNSIYYTAFETALEKERKDKADRAAKRRVDAGPSHPLEEYAGAYTHAAYGDAKLVEEEGALVLYWSTYRFPLEHWHFETFQGTDGDDTEARLTFRTDAEGKVAAFSLWTVEFTRVKEPEDGATNS